MFCKRLQATMTVNTCQKRQKKALSYMEYEACRGCPQSDQVNAGQETDQDIFKIIREISLQSPLGVQPLWETSKSGFNPKGFADRLPPDPERPHRSGFGRKRPKRRVAENSSF